MRCSLKLLWMTSCMSVRWSIHWVWLKRHPSDYSLADVFESPGRYPIVIRTYYKDANAYPFTALTVGFYDYKSSSHAGCFH